MPQDWTEIPPMPEVGLRESYYAERVKEADRLHKQHAREAYKVAQYITLGLDRRLEWEKKLRYFRHALRSHCQPPPLPSEKLWLFYGQLADLVRQHAGAEALRLASQEDDYWANQIRSGVPQPQVAAQAEIFFDKLLGLREDRPDYLNQEDYEQLQIIRNQWL